MQLVSSFITGYELNEYLLILQPHTELRNRINTIKAAFAKKYKAPLALSTKPHLTLANFVSWAMSEEKLVTRLQHIATGITPFKVELKDYGSFPTHTIYINVATRLPVKALVKELKEAQRLMKVNNDNKPHFIEEPHITICRKLKPWQYEAGWLEYSHHQFTGRFIADSMLLIRKPADTAGPYQLVKRFDFQNLAITTTQGDLFGPLPASPFPSGGGAQVE